MRRYTVVIFALLLVSLCSPAPAQWILQHDSLPASLNPEVQFSAVSEDVCWGIKQTNSDLVFIRTTNGGSNWSALTIYAPFGGSCIAAIDANTAWVAIHDTSGMTSGGVFKTTNGGIDWEWQASAFPNAGGYPDDIHFFDPNNGVVLGDPVGIPPNWEIYTTTNGGTLWTRVPSSSIPLSLPGEFSLNGLFASAANNIWFGTVAGGNNGVYRSTDRGRTWSVTRNLPGNVGFCVAFKDTLNGLSSNCFGGLGNRIARTTDGGVTWTAIQNVPDTPSSAFISYVPRTRGSYIITSTSNIGFPEPTIPGSAYTLDDGNHWTWVDSLPHWRAAFVSATAGWSAGASDTVYKWAGPSLPVAETGIELPSRFELHQNYPNPFNPSTKIVYRVASREFIEVGVYDILGRKVARLVDEVKQPGTYTVQWDASGVASGVYFYRFQAGQFSEVQKMLLIR